MPQRQGRVRKPPATCATRSTRAHILSDSDGSALLCAGCACSGEFRPRDSRADFTELLQSFTHIAQYHKFEWLEETAGWLLDNAIDASGYTAVSYTR